MTAKAQKVMVIGYDGADPVFVNTLIGQGKLPNFKRMQEMGVTTESIGMIGALPTITPPCWATLANGAWPGTHGITCFWNHTRGNELDELDLGWSSKQTSAEFIWDAYAKAGKKSVVFNYPTSFPPTSKENVIYVDGTNAEIFSKFFIDMDKLYFGVQGDFELKADYHGKNDTGAGCVIEDIPEAEDVFDANSILGGDAMSMRNIIFKHSDGEDGIEDVAVDLCNSPIKDAAGWADAPADAKEFYCVTSDGLIRRPCLILKNEAGVYDRVAYYHSKKDAEPVVVLKKDDYTVGVVDEFLHKEQTVLGNRNMLLMDLAEDGSMVRLWMSKAFDIAHDTLFHPRSIYKQVVENVGYIPPNPTFGGKNLEIVNRIMLPTWEVLCQWQAKALNFLIDENGYQVVFSHIHNVDAMGHMFWYYGKNRPKMNKMEEEGYQKAIEEAYLQTDRYLGQFLHYLDEGWTIMIFSDHGLLTPEEEEKPLIGDAFGCNVKVMQELGFTILKKDENGNDIKEIDWEKTRAVATRGGQIYINLKGKYPTGIVDPADKYELEREIIDGLYSYRLNGKRVIAVAMRNKDAVNLGTGGPECGDVLYWLEEGVNRLHGDALPEVQGYQDTTVTPIFIAAGQGLKKGYKCPRIIRQADMTPTVAHMLGVRMPAQCEGAVIHQILAD